MRKRTEETLPEDRALTAEESALVTWLIRHPDPSVSISDAEREVSLLRVVGRCGCGCASVDFAAEAKSQGAKPIANATGKDSSGRECGIILWGRARQLTALEIYEYDPGSAAEVSAIETLQAYDVT
jgi:hypothetical protein